eukprot:scaffold10222_cov135-Isochrysis_galbana.AAC.7
MACKHTCTRHKDTPDQCTINNTPPAACLPKRQGAKGQHTARARARTSTHRVQSHPHHAITPGHTCHESSHSRAGPTQNRHTHV